ncbi:MAG: hypothetical protein RXQ68_03190 [Candidatus Nanopusillus sp.]
MSDKFINLNSEVYFWIYKLLSTAPTNLYEEELGTEFVKKYGEKLVEYAKNSYEEYQKELQKLHNKLYEVYGKTLDELLKKIDNSVSCKEETYLNPYDPHKRSLIYQYTYINHFKTNIIRIINKHLEGLYTTQLNYGKEIMNILYVLRSLSKLEVYKTLLAAYMLTEYYALDDILSTPENSSINDKMIGQIKRLKASNDVQNYIHAIQDYIQKQIEWTDLAYQKASKYIEDIIEELFRKNTNGFNIKIERIFLKYLKGIY